MTLLQIFPSKIQGYFSSGSERHLLGGDYAAQSLKFWSSSTNLVTKLYLQPSPSPVDLQHVSCDPSNCCDVLGVELVLTDRAVLNSRAGLLGWPGHEGAYIEVL
jgi:hypothetical protein